MISQSDIVPSVSAVALSQELDGTNPPALLDVREAEERLIAVLNDSLHIPLMELEARAVECAELVKNAGGLVVYCRSGARSAVAVEFLLKSGFSEVRNLDGGILAWSREVDPSLPQY